MQQKITTFNFHATSIYVPETNMPHILITSCADIRQLCLYIHVIWTPFSEQC